MTKTAAIVVGAALSAAVAGAQTLAQTPAQPSQAAVTFGPNPPGTAFAEFSSALASAVTDLRGVFLSGQRDPGRLDLARIEPLQRALPQAQAEEARKRVEYGQRLARWAQYVYLGKDASRGDENSDYARFVRLTADALSKAPSRVGVGVTPPTAAETEAHVRTAAAVYLSPNRP